MADWIVAISTDPLRFPVVDHRHPNGTLRAVRERTPAVTMDLAGHREEAWTYVCACGDVYVWERRAVPTAPASPPGTAP
jgi:hypothetical protein